MMSGTLFTTLLILLNGNPLFNLTGDPSDNQLIVKKTEDFTVTGDGKSVQWNKTVWLPITVQESSGGPVSRHAH